MASKKETMRAASRKRRELQNKRRAEAQMQGLPHYDPGHPCRNGHNSVRTTGAGICVMCREQLYIKNTRYVKKTKTPAQLAKKATADLFKKVKEGKVKIDDVKVETVADTMTIRLKLRQYVRQPVAA